MSENDDVVLKESAKRSLIFILSNNESNKNSHAPLETISYNFEINTTPETIKLLEDKLVNKHGIVSVVIYNVYLSI